jgi:hypothetical protein
MAFRKGQSGNPGGRPKEKPFRDALRIELASRGEDSKSLRAIAGMIITKAEEGDLHAAREIADRLDGRPTQEAEVLLEKRHVHDFTDAELVELILSADDNSPEALALRDHLQSMAKGAQGAEQT